MVIVLLSGAVVGLVLLNAGLLLLLFGFSQIYTKMEKRALLAEEALAHGPSWRLYSDPASWTARPSTTERDTYQS
jgi:hypothetical protein